MQSSRLHSEPRHRLADLGRVMEQPVPTSLRPCAPAPVPAAVAAVCPRPTQVRMTVREALRDAMAEEMRRDGAVFLMGEEVGQYQGAYKISQGLLEEFGAKRVINAITEMGFAGLAVGAAFALDRLEIDLDLVAHGWGGIAP